MPKITIIKIIHFTIDFLLAGFHYNSLKPVIWYIIRINFANHFSEYIQTVRLFYLNRRGIAHCTGNQQENEVKAGAFYIVDQSREQMVILTYCAIY